MKYQVLDPNTKHHQFPSQFQLVFPSAMVFCSVLCVCSGLSRRQPQETKFLLSYSWAPSAWEPQKGEQNTDYTCNVDLVFPDSFVPDKQFLQASPMHSFFASSELFWTFLTVFFQRVAWPTAKVFCDLERCKAVQNGRDYFIYCYLCLYHQSLEKPLCAAEAWVEALFAFGKMCKEIPFQNCHRSKYPS